MTVWTVYVQGEPEFSSDKFFEAASRASTLVGMGFPGIEVKKETVEHTPVEQPLTVAPGS